MGEDILSRDELDALMDGVKSGEVATEAGSAAPGEVRAHDFARRDRSLQGRLPGLDQIVERASRQLRDNYYRMLRRRPEIASDTVRIETFEECLNTLAPNASVHVVRAKPLRGNGFVAIDAALVSTFVDFFFGGAGGPRRQGAPRELTAGEQRVVQIALRDALSAFTAAWAPVTALELEIAGHAANLQYATLHASRDLVCTSRLHVAFEGGEGNLRFVLPYATIEPVRHLLDGSPKSERVEGDARWTANLRDDVLDAEIELSSNLVETPIRIGDFLKLRPGDVIPIDIPELVTLGADAIPLFHARVGTAGGNNALRLVEPVRLKSRDSGFGIRDANVETEVAHPKSKVTNTKH
jgi:flagellar motor switch protein FliM